MSTTAVLESPAIAQLDNYASTLSELSEDELQAVDGGINWWGVGAGVAAMIAVGFAVPTGGASLAAYALYGLAAAGTTAGFMSAVYD